MQQPTCPFDHGSQPGDAAGVAAFDRLTYDERTALYTDLRHAGGVTYTPARDAWLVTSYELCNEVYQQPERFSSAQAATFASAFRQSPAARAVLKTSQVGSRARTLLQTDPPEHTRYRRIMQRALEPGKFMRQITPRVREIVAGLLDSAAATGRFDAVTDYAVHVPIRVIAAVLDVPEHDVARLKLWTDHLFAVQIDNVDEETVVQAAHSVIEMEAYFLAKIADRRAAFRDDFLGRLLDSSAGDDALSDAEVLNLIVHVMVGGTESTTNFLGTLIYLLLSTDGLLDRLRADRARIPGVIEECLRFGCPLEVSIRIAVGEQRIGDTIIPDGGRVLIAIASANRDEQQLGDGDFDENRDMRGAPHLTFGRGIHACIGQQLARREALITVEGLLDRISAPRLDPQGTPAPLDTLGAIGYRHLPLVTS
jgi:cytochrome P450